MKTLFDIKGFTLLLSAVIYFYFSSLAMAAAAPKPEAAKGSSPAAGVIGQVVWVKGDVKAMGEGKTRALQRRSPIYNKDTIVTDKTSTGQIVFSDNSLVALTADTTFQISDYQFNKNTPGKGKFVATLVKGGFRTVTGLIPKQNADNYQVNTPVATIGVRGTGYALVYKGRLFAKYFSGIPCLNNKKGRFCLDATNQFAGVANADSAPIKLSYDPGVFKDIPELTPSNFDSNLRPSTVPKGNSFCIQ